MPQNTTATARAEGLTKPDLDMVVKVTARQSQLHSELGKFIDALQLAEDERVPIEDIAAEIGLLNDMLLAMLQQDRTELKAFGNMDKLLSVLNAHDRLRQDWCARHNQQAKA